MNETKTKDAGNDGDAADDRKDDAADVNGEKEAGNNNSNSHQQQLHGGKKRKREKIDHYAMAYENVRFEPIVAKPQPIEIAGVDYAIHTTTPGSPSRQFKYSYRVTFLETKHTATATPLLNQVIHQHANGLCIVTAGEHNQAHHLPASAEMIERIEFLATTADPCSAGARRKRQSKMLRKGTASVSHKNQKTSNNNNNNNNDPSTTNSKEENDTATQNDGMVTPDTILAKIHCRANNNNQDETGTTTPAAIMTTTSLPIYAGVWGSLLELHTSLTPEQLTHDPLLNGYVAVILPTGPFPPKECVVSTQPEEAVEDGIRDDDNGGGEVVPE